MLLNIKTDSKKIKNNKKSRKVIENINNSS